MSISIGKLVPFVWIVTLKVRLIMFKLKSVWQLTKVDDMSLKFCALFLTWKITHGSHWKPIPRSNNGNVNLLVTIYILLKSQFEQPNACNINRWSRIRVHIHKSSNSWLNPGVTCMCLCLRPCSSSCPVSRVWIVLCIMHPGSKNAIKISSRCHDTTTPLSN